MAALIEPTGVEGIGDWPHATLNTASGIWDSACSNSATIALGATPGRTDASHRLCR